MSFSKKYLSILAAFILGVGGAAGYAVHAQSANQIADSSSSSPVSVGTTRVSDGDGEQADDTEDAADAQLDAQDPEHLDGETADDAPQTMTVASSTQETEAASAGNGLDTGEVED